MKFIYALLLILAYSPSTAFSQHRDGLHHARMSKAASSAFLKSYIDSLVTIKAKLDSAQVYKDSVSVVFLPDSKYYSLFVPLTFYHNIAEERLELDSLDSNDEVSDALYSIYMKRPDLVRSTQSQIDEVGPLISSEPKTVTPDANILEKTETSHENNAPLSFDIMVRKPNFWKFYGDYGLQIFQNYVSSNWYKGGESNYSVLGTIALQANYNNKSGFRWENKLEMKLGVQNSRSDTLHRFKSTEDLLRYTGKIGIQASKKWYYTLQLIASTQFMRGFKSNDAYIYSDFLSPITINPSVGMDYGVDWFKGRLKGSIHLAPLAYNWKYVHRIDLATRYGIDEGYHSASDFGSELTIDLAWNITNDISWKTRLYGYTSYKRSLVEWENTISFRVNRYITSNLFVYPRFDDSVARDDHHGYWMFKEYISLGFAYSF